MMALSSLTPDNDPLMSQESQPRHVLKRGVTGARAKDVGSDGGTMLGNDYEDGSAPDNCGGNTFRGFIVNMCIKVCDKYIKVVVLFIWKTRQYSLHLVITPS